MTVTHRSGCAAWTPGHPQTWVEGDDALCDCGADELDQRGTPPPLVSPGEGAKELVARITNYLSVGGLFNPEQMEHEKVRDLLLDCRNALGAASGVDRRHPSDPKEPNR